MASAWTWHNCILTTRSGSAFQIMNKHRVPIKCICQCSQRNRTNRVWMLAGYFRTRKNQCSTLKALCGEGSAFCSNQDFNRLTKAHSHYEGKSALLSLSIHMLVPLQNILMQTPWIIFDQISGTLWPGQIDT